MLEFCGRKFTCDECPICEGIEHMCRSIRGGGFMTSTPMKGFLGLP